jgi:hypothetical protein
MLMTMVLNKKQMTEEDIKTQYITPAITAKWNLQKITMETQITDGRINLKGNFAFREKPKRVDYLLYLSANNPIAVVEAKDNSHSIYEIENMIILKINPFLKYSKPSKISCYFGESDRDMNAVQELVDTIYLDEVR